MSEWCFWFESPDLGDYKPLTRMSFSSRKSASTCLRRYYFERTGYKRNQFFNTLKGSIVHNSIDSLKNLLADEGCINEENIGEIFTNKNLNFKTIMDAEIAKIFEKSTENPRFARVERKFESQLNDKKDQMIRMVKKGIKNLFNDENKFVGNKSNKGSSGKSASIEIRVGTYIEEDLFSQQLNDTGTIDKLIVEENEVHIIDFKTGKENPSHEEQLYFYQILWFDDQRNIENKEVSKLEIDYLNDNKQSYRPLTNSEIENKKLEYISQKEDLLKLKEVEQFLPTINEDCRFCFCRQNCEEYWKTGNQTERDIEDVIESTQAHPFKAKSSSKGFDEYRVFFQNQNDFYIRMLEEGKKYRILNSFVDDGSSKIQIYENSEVFSQEHFSSI